jgi:hypothetical protein
VRETLCPVGTVLGVERDAFVRLVDLHAVAVMLNFIEPTLAFGQAIAQRRLAGRMKVEERGTDSDVTIGARGGNYRDSEEQTSSLGIVLGSATRQPPTLAG